jgi:hypothetical protein
MKNYDRTDEDYFYGIQIQIITSIEGTIKYV